MKKRLLVVFVLLAVALAACSNADGRWHTHEAYSRPTPAGGTGAAYFMLHNATETDDVLIGASSPVAEAVEIHMSSLMAESSVDAEGQEANLDQADNSDDDAQAGMDHSMGEAEMQDMSHVGSMVMVERVELAAGDEIPFEPGGYHIMLINLQQELKAGDVFELTLHFEQSEAITIEVTVMAP